MRRWRRCWIAAISSSTAATSTLLRRCAGRRRWRRRTGYTLWAWASAGGQRARAMAPASCPAVAHTHTTRWQGARVQETLNTAQCTGPHTLLFAIRPRQHGRRVGASSRHCYRCAPPDLHVHASVAHLCVAAPRSPNPTPCIPTSEPCTLHTKPKPYTLSPKS